MPLFKRAGSKIFGCEFNAKENKALMEECLRQEAEYTRKYATEIEAMVLRQLRERYGFGYKRLKEFFDTFDDDLEALAQRYEMGDADKAWLCTQQLKEEGFDIEAWHREKYPDE